MKPDLATSEIQCDFWSSATQPFQISEHALNLYMGQKQREESAFGPKIE